MMSFGGRRLFDREAVLVQNHVARIFKSLMPVVMGCEKSNCDNSLRAVRVFCSFIRT